MTLHSVLATEFIHTTGGIQNLLFTGVEGMAGRADFYMQLIVQSGTSHKVIAATAGDLDLLIVRMGVSFHASVPA